MFTFIAIPNNHLKRFTTKAMWIHAIEGTAHQMVLDALFMHSAHSSFTVSV